MGDDGGRAPGDVQALLAQRKTACCLRASWGRELYVGDRI